MTALATPETGRFRRSACPTASLHSEAGTAASAAASVPPTGDESTTYVSDYMRRRREEYYAVVRRGGGSFRPRLDTESSDSLIRSLVLTAGFLMPYEAAEELATAADTIPNVARLAQTKAVESTGETCDEVDSRSWRGVFVVEYPDEVLFTKRIDIRPDQLDEWEPEPVTSRRPSEYDD